MLDQAGVGIAQSIAALGATGILALVFVLWLRGTLHSEDEVRERDEEAQRQLAYRELLRAEAVVDRKAADERTAALTKALAESNEITKRTLDLIERQLEDRKRDGR